MARATAKCSVTPTDVQADVEYVEDIGGNSDSDDAGDMEDLGARWGPMLSASDSDTSSNRESDGEQATNPEKSHHKLGAEKGRTDKDRTESVGCKAQQVDGNRSRTQWTEREVEIEMQRDDVNMR